MHSLRCGICDQETMALLACVKCGMTLCEKHVVRDEVGIPLCPHCASGRSPGMAKLFKALAILGAILLILLQIVSPEVIEAVRGIIRKVRKRSRRGD